ncbi:VRR-NUC domain-containing protein [Moraxella sp. K127]|uniref:VRR-NUC domain-containing protein n=1 Tax=Moraxella sp. K127 TaxID=2780079 RepID=UPI0018806042|nr:VRR-NUC domain-containing protein [Moraxella sp. K127]MBE9590003.1 VRR-NUC domain-containing protein [Moraxella sp. K127]
MSEDNEQKAILAWARWQKWADGKLADYLHHSPNGGKRHITTATRFKAMGTKAGFPDLFLFIPCGGYHGLFIELKTPKGKTATGKTRQAGKVSDLQQAMIDRLNAQGYKAVVAYGATGAIDEIKSYLGVDK